MATPETLYLLDSHAIIYRAFYAMENLRAPDGRPTNAIFQFVRILNNLRKDHRPQYLIAVFDAAGKNFRHQKFPDYKATRKPTPPELREQIPAIREIVEKYNIATAILDGYEADDLIGTLARQAEKDGMNVVILSGDKDLAQLLSPQITLFDPQRNRQTTLDDFIKNNGFTPERLPDLFGLWGDASDNIPGVAGIGEKIGRELIQQYGTLESVLEHANFIKGKRGTVLRASKADALLSKDLATICTTAPITFDRENSRIKHPDLSALRGIFLDYGFGTLLKELEHIEEISAPRQPHEYNLINTPEKFAAFLSALSAQTYFAVDTETTGTNPLTCELVGLSFSWANHTAFYLPFQASANEKVLSPEMLIKLKPILENPEIAKCGQNYKYDYLVLRRVGIELNGVIFDTLLASSLLTAHLRGHDLDTLSARYLGREKIPTSSIIGSGSSQITMAQVAVEKVCEYACEDADMTWQLANLLHEKLGERGRKFLREIELPLSKILCAMQWRGIRVDAEILAHQSNEITTLLNVLTAEIFALADAEFNLDSPKQLATILFDKLQLPIIRKTPTGAYSTDESVLSELVNMGFELPLRLLDYRQYAKLKNTYIDALPRLINPQTGRVHTTFAQSTTATGRLSSVNPNLQNIPIRSEKGRAIRAAFVTEKNWSLLAADYSQIELRVLAHFTGDHALHLAFMEDRDIHRVVAAAVNKISEDEVTDAQRRSAKAINFGIIYGQTAHGLANATGMNRVQAQNFIDQYFADFPSVRAYIEETLQRATLDGAVQTMFGRRREIPELKSSKKQDAERGQREAINTIIQGTAAEIIKLAMIKLSARLQNEKMAAQILLQIHDELVLEAPNEEIEQLQNIVREEMENAVKLSVPLKVDMGVGENWLTT